MAKHSVTAAGRLVADPTAVGDKGMVAARVVIQDGYGDREATFANLKLFKNDAEFLLKYGKKGQPFTVLNSRVEVRTYQTKEGETRASLELVGGMLDMPKIDGISGGAADEDSPF